MDYDANDLKALEEQGIQTIFLQDRSLSNENFDKSKFEKNQHLVLPNDQEVPHNFNGLYENAIVLCFLGSSCSCFCLVTKIFEKTEKKATVKLALIGFKDDTLAELAFDRNGVACYSRYVVVLKRCHNQDWVFALDVNNYKILEVPVSKLRIASEA